MLIGDPYNFAIIFDRVAEWNVSLTDNNGYFALCVDGKMFPNEVINAVVPVSVSNVKNALINIPTNEKIYDMDTEKAFMALYELVYPDYDNDEDRDNDYRYLLAPPDLTDLNCLVFAVEAKEKIRILAAKIEYDFEEERDIFDNSVITEVTLEKNEIDKIIKRIEFDFR